MFHARKRSGAMALALVLCHTPLVSYTAAAQAAPDAAALAKSARCNMCHDAEAQRMGPSWAAIAERYEDTEGAVELLAERSRAGVSGQWGKASMPAVSEDQLSDEELKAVLRWVLDR